MPGAAKLGLGVRQQECRAKKQIILVYIIENANSGQVVDHNCKAVGVVVGN